LRSKLRAWRPTPARSLRHCSRLRWWGAHSADHRRQRQAKRGTITLVIQVIGATTERLCSLREGDALCDVVGPLGKATEIEKFGHVVLVGGGVGTAVIYPQASAMKAKGNRVTAVMGGRSKEYVILEQELKAICDAVYPCTDDGSYGYNGFVTGKLGELIADPALPVNAVITAGPVPMMKAIANVTRDKGILTIASLNPIMVDGTGMCGGCRVTVGGKVCSPASTARNSTPTRWTSPR
jgi:ferredoxin--NADP+ reductase